MYSWRMRVNYFPISPFPHFPFLIFSFLLLEWPLLLLFLFSLTNKYAIWDSRNQLSRVSTPTRKLFGLSLWTSPCLAVERLATWKWFGLLRGIRWKVIHHAEKTAPTFLGINTSWIALTLVGSGQTPDLSTIWPGNLTCFWENLHFSLLSVDLLLPNAVELWVNNLFHSYTRILTIIYTTRSFYPIV